MRTLVLLLCSALAGFAAPAEYRAAVSRADITPAGPIWMSGYASRNKPSEGVLQRLSAKALALEDKRGTKLVIVTTDLIGLPRSITDVVGARVEKQFGVNRARVLLNSSHTHTGPLVRGNLPIMAELSESDQRTVNQYASTLTDQLVTLISDALGALRPASISYGEGTANFAMNRRERTPTGTVKLGLNPQGPGDHSVPVLRIDDASGKPVAVLFGYACHNTTLTGEHYQISGDYAGIAQADIESAMPGTMALFLQLCGGDQNPNPRGETQHIQQHGRALADEVTRLATGSKLTPVRGRLAATLTWRDLPIQAATRADFEGMLAAKDPARVRFAKEMLRRMDERQPMRSVPYPVQAFRLGDGLVLVGLGGEVVVEYDLQIKSAHPKTHIIVAGYSNDVMGYIPTAKMLAEGGYEPVASTIYYGQAAPFSPELEKIILETADEAIRRVKP